MLVSAIIQQIVIDFSRNSIVAQEQAQEPSLAKAWEAKEIETILDGDRILNDWHCHLVHPATSNNQEVAA